MPDEKEFSDASSEVPLGEMIEVLRHELQYAQSRGVGQEIVFEIDKVDLELKVVVSRTLKADGKIAFWVVNAGGGLEHGAENVHTFNITLSPVTVGGERLKISKDTNSPSADG